MDPSLMLTKAAEIMAPDDDPDPTPLPEDHDRARCDTCSPRILRAAEVRAIRSALGLSLNAFAAALGVNARTPRTWESGRTALSPGSSAAIRDLARAFYTASTDDPLSARTSRAGDVLQQASPDLSRVVWGTRLIAGIAKGEM